MTQPRILVIDDDVITLERFNTLLKNRYEVLLCDSAVSAIASVDLKRLDLVLCDVSMPDVSGFEALRAIHRHNPDVPVVLMSSDSEGSHYLPIAQSFGATSAMDKLDGDAEILGTIESLLFP